MRKLRLTHVVFDLDGGGLESLVLSLAACFQGTDVEMSVISLSGREGSVGRSVRPLLTEYRVLKPMRGVSLLYPRSLINALIEMRPDVVHLHSGAWLKGVVAARGARVPKVIFTEHGREHDDPLLSRRLDALAAMGTDCVVTVSERLARYMINVLRIPASKVSTVGNGVDTLFFSPSDDHADLRQTLDLPSNAVVVGSVGRLESVKAYDRLLQAVATVQRMTAQPIACVLWGDGSQKSYLRARAEALGILPLTRFPGWTERSRDAHRALDVFALTSRSEGASISLMEAMACGTAPIVTDVGANAEVLGPEMQGQVVPEGDPQALAVVLADTVRSAELRAHLGRVGRSRIVARYSVPSMAAGYEAIYRA